MAVPLLTRKIVKKRVKHFKRAHSDRYIGLKEGNDVLVKGLRKRTFSSVTIGMKTYCAEIAHNVSTKKRKDILDRAAQLDIVVTNKAC